jgi:hypothetical protein
MGKYPCVVVLSANMQNTLREVNTLSSTIHVITECTLVVRYIMKCVFIRYLHNTKGFSSFLKVDQSLLSPIIYVITECTLVVRYIMKCIFIYNFPYSLKHKEYEVINIYFACVKRRTTRNGRTS